MDFLHDRQTILAQKWLNVNNNTKSFAFTLAETLITLGIIGVVAAMTIGSLIQNAKKQEYVTRFKKAYTTLSQVVKLIAYEGGCINNLDCTFNGLSNEEQGDILASKYSLAKNCKMTLHEEEGVCFSNSVDEYGLFGTKNSESSYDTCDFYRFVTSDGTAYSWKLADGPYYIDNLVIDVNGPQKAPNQIGRDIFILRIGRDTKITSSLFPSIPNTCNSTDKDASTCADRLIEEGWQMKY